jgi:riboflavin kinase
MHCIKIVGKVFSGVGEGRIYIELYRREIEKALGINPYPGTLNIKVEQEYIDATKRLLTQTNPHAVIKPPRDGLAPVLAWKAYVRSIAAYLIKPLKTVWGFDVIELIAEENLRNLLKLADGNAVEVFVPIASNLKCWEDT